MSAVETPPLQEMVAILDRALTRANDTAPNPDVKWRVELPLTAEEYQRFFAIIRGSRNPPPAIRFDLTLVGHGY